VNALKLFQEVNNIRVIGAIQNNIGNIHLRQGRYEEALKYYDEAIKTAKKEEAIHNAEIERQKLGIAKSEDLKGKPDPHEALKNVDVVKTNRTHQWCTALMAMPRKNQRQWKKLSERLHIVIQSDLKNARNLPRVVKNLINMAHALTGKEYIL
jgi:tetratricopeptide (TPR) repeat protein